jgi:hypothetical protein
MNGHACNQFRLTLCACCCALNVPAQGDFLEGVRAVLIDKDNAPRWRYTSTRDVPPALLAELFSPLPGQPPLFPAQSAAAAAHAGTSKM